MLTLSRHIALSLAAGACLACSHGRADVEPAPSGPMMGSTTSSTSSSMSGDSTRSMPSTANEMGSSSTMSSGPMTTSSASRSDMHGNAMERREVHSAIHTLTRAKHVLEHAGHEFGGHRTNALRAVDAALHELHIVAGQEMQPQTAREEKIEDHEIRRGIGDLERARRDMETAKHDFRGRRAETLRAVDEALRELRVAAENEK